MTWGRNLVRPFGRVCSTRGPGESFEPESDSLRARARAAWTIDDARPHGPGLRIRTGLRPASVSTGTRPPSASSGRSARNIHGRYGGSARALPARFPSPGERAGLNNRREAA